ncbi:hypothetical protein [Beggiatoa leptomitoformis]|uniref:Curli production assembly/transport component CsgG n=1 Tax=Beggiatoa leptomitoformis TaxID=288004 RepID=A0A2N9YCQ2_9GAMM|nr:hypothetical protein [Beggiatoa leptomitoformis]ALG66509.1 hypothetical protein AL038_00620 [Beggiatoa leptomitoformis]AUI68194.1 hypothetical protein BLE401_05425 [Beggiatoa leptomitoformis]
MLSAVKKKQFTSYLIGLLNLLLISCSTTDQLQRVKEPETLPTPRKTVLSDGLACFGDMLAEYRRLETFGQQLRPLNIAIVSVKDATGISSEEYNHEVPSNMTELALGVAAKIGGALRIANIPADEEITNALRLKQLGFTQYEQAFKVKQYLSDAIVIYGALTEYDRLLDNAKRSFNAGSDFGGGKGATTVDFSTATVTNIARITMDFRIVFNGTGDIVNHASATNTLLLYQNAHDLSFGISINSQSIGHLTSITEVDARHAAIRLLVEMGLISSLGKYNLVPYWQCLPTATHSPYIAVTDVLTAEKPHDENDIRDADVINAIKAEFENFEYLESHTNVHKHLPRAQNDMLVSFQTTLPTVKEITEQFSTDTIQALQSQGWRRFDGRQTKLKKLLTLHQHNHQELAHLSLQETLQRLTTDYIKAGILDETVTVTDSRLYVALWLNLPIRHNARWEY